MKKMMMITAAAVCIATPALAMTDSDMKMMGHYMMMKADMNHDGMISKDEMSAMNDKKMDMMDTNHDGMISKSEMMAGMKMEHQDMMKNDSMHNSDGMMNR